MIQMYDAAHYFFLTLLLRYYVNKTEFSKSTILFIKFSRLQSPVHNFYKTGDFSVVFITIGLLDCDLIKSQSKHGRGNQNQN